MEFNEKLQELRKGRGLTQEELAQALFVSRTAVSKWESGRGYPSIDSLKEVSRFFSVSIDELIRTEEIISAAADEKQALARRTVSFIGNTLDLLTAVLIGLTALNGLCGLILIRFDRQVWNRHRLYTGMALSVLGVGIFIAARQPYAGIFYFALLVIKSFGIMKLRGYNEHK